MKKVLGIFFLFLTSSAWAASDVAVKLGDVQIDRSDYASLQRGAAVFVNYCLGCHSAKYVRFDHIENNLGINQNLMSQYLHLNTAKLTDGLISNMSAEEGRQWFNQATIPDLSLSARLRGKDWLYSYLRGFYRDTQQSSGWNNTVFPNVAMPNVFVNVQGMYELDENNQRHLVKPGDLSPKEFDVMITDLVNFMDFMADPDRPDRHRAGYLILAFLMILLVFSYNLYREYWNDIHS